MYVIRRNAKDLETQGWHIVRITNDDIPHIDTKEQDPNYKLYVGEKPVKEIIAYGNPYDNDKNDITIFSLLKKHVPSFPTKQSHSGLGYICYANVSSIESQKRNNCIIHEDYKSAINCLMRVLRNPDNVLIFK